MFSFVLWEEKRRTDADREGESSTNLNLETEFAYGGEREKEEKRRKRRMGWRIHTNINKKEGQKKTFEVRKQQVQCLLRLGN